MAEKNTARQQVEQNRAARYRTVALHALTSLSAGDRRPKTLHRLRTHLRRLQAYLELVGEEENAKTIARCVSRFSRLRTLHVFDRYLDRCDATGRDRRLVTQRIRGVESKLKKKQAYRKVERVVEHYALPPTPAASDWMGRHLIALRTRHAGRLRELIARADADPRRKTLHRLRLMIKSVRYQEEWALGEPYARPDRVAWLKQAQTVLGEYEELAQFRKLAAKLRLMSQPLIDKDWRRARKRARMLPARLTELVAGMARGHLRLVRAAGPFAKGAF